MVFLLFIIRFITTIIVTMVKMFDSLRSLFSLTLGFTLLLLYFAFYI